MLNGRVFDTPNQDIYNKDTFLTKVNIEMILFFGKLISFIKPKIHKKEKIFFSTVHQKDAMTQAICIANNLIQYGDKSYLHPKMIQSWRTTNHLIQLLIMYILNKVGEDVTILHQNQRYMVIYILQFIKTSCLNFLNKEEQTLLKK